METEQPVKFTDAENAILDLGATFVSDSAAALTVVDRTPFEEGLKSDRTRFDKEHGGLTVLGEPRSDHTTGAAGADYDVVVHVLVRRHGRELGRRERPLRGAALCHNSG